MLKYLLGIDVTSPGAATVSVAPPDRGLDHASGSQWTQRGRVSVDWTRAATAPYVSLDVTVPDNVVAKVSLPTGASTRRYVATGEGKPAYGGVADGRETYTVGSGVTHFELDLAPPVTTATLAPPTPNGTNGWYTVPVQVTLTADDDEGSGVALTEYNLDGSGWQTYTAPFTVSADGQHSVQYRSTDVAGNVESPGSVSFKIDKTPPVVTYTGNAGSYTVDQTVSIQCSASDPSPGSGVASTTCANVDAPAYTFPLGPTTLSATATDAAGNVGSGSTTFTVSVTFASLEALVSRFSTSPDVASGLNDKLQAAAKAKNANARNNQLDAFENQLRAQTGKAFTDEQAAILLQLERALR